MHLKWDPVERADSYYVQRSTLRYGPYTTVSPRLTATTFVDQGLNEGTPYYYVVVAANDSGRSPPSNEVGAIPPGMRPAAPTGLSATPGEGSVFLNWEDNLESNLFGYHVFRSITRGAPYAAIREFVTASEYTDDGIPAGPSYYYVVTAVVTAADGGMIQSSPSNEAVADYAWQSQDIRNVAAAGYFVN